MTRIYNVTNLGSYIEAVSEISHEDKNGQNENMPDILWFRGISHTSHCLIPGLFRTKTKVEKEVKSDYSKLHYAEDIRTQHYIAKNYHYFSKVPESRIEWLEVMQHHGVKTRALDWSESSIHSLLFAVEGFLDELKYTDEKRGEIVPSIWVLKPQELNKGIMESICNNIKLMSELLVELDLNESETNKIIENVRNYREYSNIQEIQYMNYILNISTINDEILRDRPRIKELLIKGDILFPYHYFLARVYSDGHVLDNRILPPLAVVNPYHSERIKAQKGVFTIFPFYKDKEEDTDLRELGIEPNAMEHNVIAQECLVKLEICDPEKIAYELMANGANISWLYPELPIVSNEIENHRIY